MILEQNDFVKFNHTINSSFKIIWNDRIWTYDNASNLVIGDETSYLFMDSNGQKSWFSEKAMYLGRIRYLENHLSDVEKENSRIKQNLPSAEKRVVKYVPGFWIIAYNNGNYGDNGLTSPDVSLIEPEIDDDIGFRAHYSWINNEWVRDD